MDPITDMLNRIRNAQMAQKPEVEIPYSGIKLELAEILEKMKFIGKIDRIGKKNRKYITVELKYDGHDPIINGIKRMSKQGQRSYTGYRDIKLVKGGKGISIISTSKGLMTNLEARKQKIGGEVLMEIW